MPLCLSLLLAENTAVKMMVQNLTEDHLEPPIQSLCGHFRLQSNQSFSLTEKIWKLKNQLNCQFNRFTPLGQQFLGLHEQCAPGYSEIKVFLFQLPRFRCSAESEHLIPDLCQYKSSLLSRAQCVKKHRSHPPTSAPVIFINWAIWTSVQNLKRSPEAGAVWPQRKRIPIIYPPLSITNSSNLHMHDLPVTPHPGNLLLWQRLGQTLAPHWVFLLPTALPCHSLCQELENVLGSDFQWYLQALHPWYPAVMPCNPVLLHIKSSQSGETLPIKFCKEADPNLDA